MTRARTHEIWRSFLVDAAGNAYDGIVEPEK